MAITFYYGSGSPFAWRVWLALEHKGVPYELKLLSFSAGDTRKPEFLALNPRHKVPVITDGDFSLYESAAILEYLDERFPPASAAQALFPGDAKQRALVRRLTREVDVYFYPPQFKLARQAFFVKEPERDAKEIASAKEEVRAELEFLERAFQGEYLAGALSAADFTLYPMLALLARIEQRFFTDLGLIGSLGQKLSAWRGRMESLPYFAKTIPPHWK